MKSTGASHRTCDTHAKPRPTAMAALDAPDALPSSAVYRYRYIRGMAATGDLIKRVRLGAGLTQAALAKRAGTSQANVAKYEAGRTSPSVSTLERLLQAAGFGLQLVATPDRTPSDLSGARARKLRRHRMQIIALARSHNATNVRIFGSIARGEDDAGSDIDLLVDFDVSQGLMPIVGLKRELEDLLSETVDVAPLALLKPAVAQRALAEAVPL